MPKKEKKDIITNREFTIISNPPHKGHNPLPDEIDFDDENEDTLEETLIGMEYDVDTGEDYWPEENEENLEEEEEKPREPLVQP